MGIAGYDRAAYVDLPGNMLSVVSQTGDMAKETAAFFSHSMHASIFESTAVQQTSGVSAVSTVKLIDLAAQSNLRIYDARSSNYTGAVRPNLVNCAAWLSTFQNAVNAGRRLILPSRCGLTENSWSGVGYFDIGVSGGRTAIGAIIGGGMAGGFSTTPQTEANYTATSSHNTQSWRDLTQTFGRFFNDPIDRVTGNFSYAHEDIKVGVGEFPYALAFQRLYSSGLRARSDSLGRGWTHNFIATATVGSDGFQGLGEDSALDAVNTLVEKQVALDLLSDPAKPLDKIVIATLGQRWFGDKLIGNTVIVQQGLNGEVFVKLPDGSYNPPPGNAARLLKNADNTYSYETLHRDKLNFNPAGQIATFQGADGVQVKFTYTGNNLTQVQNSLGRTLTLTYSGGRIASVSDGTRSVSYAYDGSANLATFTDATGKTTAFQYDLPGRITKVFYPANPGTPFVTNVYDTLGRIQTQTDANGKTYTYYFAGYRAEETGPLGLSRVSYFDALGRETWTMDPEGRVTRHFYDGQGRKIKTLWPEGNATVFTYDDATCAGPDKRCTHTVKTVTQVAKPGSGLANLTTSFTYESAFNRIASATDPRGQVTTYTYTAQGQLATVTQPADSSGIRPVTTYGYSGFTPAGFPTFYLLTSVTQKIDATDAVTTTFTYAPANKYVPQTVTVDAGTGKLNLTTGYTYDSVGNLTQVNGPRTEVADTVTFLYDAERRLVQTTDALGKATQTAYDANGNLVRIAAQIGAQWLVSCRSYTPSNKLLKAWGPGQTASATTCPKAAPPVEVTDYGYDDLDRLVRIIENLPAAGGGNRVQEIAYYRDDRVWQIWRAVGTGLAQAYATYTYTANGQVATVQDAKGNLTTYQYDGHDRRFKTLFPSKTTAGVSSTTDYEQYGYDAAGNLVSLRQRNGQSVILAYDNLNRLVGRRYPTAADNVSYAYDLVGRLRQANLSGYSIGYAYDHAGRITGATAGGRTVSYQYDAASNRTRITWPDGFFVTSSYDALNRPTAIRENGGALLASYAYDDLSRRTQLGLGNGTTVSYGYNAKGSLASLAYDFAGTDRDLSLTYTRNQVQEITKIAFSNAAYLWPGMSNGATTYAANGLNQYTQVNGIGHTYDANGNLTGDGAWTYTYDLDNRLKTAAKPGLSASLAYDGQGRLRQATINGAAVQFLYDGWDLIAEYDASGTLKHRYVPGPGVDEPLVWYEGTGTANKTWLYRDHLGSIIATATSSGALTAISSYGPYGEPSGSAPARFGFTDQVYLKLLGLVYYKARFYSPTLGRFLQTDPIGYRDDMNLYAYGNNDPVNDTDPSGLIAREANLLTAKLTGYLEAFTPGSLAFKQAYAAYQAGNVENAAWWGLQGSLEVAAALATAGASQRIGSIEHTLVTRLNTVLPQTPARTRNAARGAGSVVAKDGTELLGFTKHGVDRAIGDAWKRAGTTPQAILNALKNPTSIKEGVDSMGRPFKVFVGEDARVVINPQTGKIISVNPLSGRGTY